MVEENVAVLNSASVTCRMRRNRLACRSYWMVRNNSAWETNGKADEEWRRRVTRMMLDQCDHEPHGSLSHPGSPTNDVFVPNEQTQHETVIYPTIIFRDFYRLSKHLRKHTRSTFNFSGLNKQSTNMPSHPSEERAPEGLTDKIAQHSSDSNASDHPIHDENKGPIEEAAGALKSKGPQIPEGSK